MIAPEIPAAEEKGSKAQDSTGMERQAQMDTWGWEMETGLEGGLVLEQEPVGE